MMVAQGILTARGGLVSHAAVVARGWGTPAVVGAESVKIHGKSFTSNGVTVNEGDYLSLDGSSGTVVLGQMALENAAAAEGVRDHPRLGRRGALEGQASDGRARQRRHRRGRHQGP